MFVDSHAHLTAREFDADRDDVICRAVEAGVECIINPSTDLEDAQRALELAERHPGVYAAVGIHPHEALKGSGEVLSAIESLTTHPKVVAVGEIGLDYHYDFAPKEVQRRVFRDQLRMARRLDLPVIIHTRDSIEDTVQMVEEEGSTSGVFHCFSGDAAMARRVIARGFAISFPGIVTFKKPGHAPDVVAETALDHLLLETDSPYLAPVPHRGKRNEPMHIPLIAQKIAELKGTSLEAVRDATTGAVVKLFGMSVSS